MEIMVFILNPISSRRALMAIMFTLLSLYSNAQTKQVERKHSQRLLVGTRCRDTIQKGQVLVLELHLANVGEEVIRFRGNDNKNHLVAQLEGDSILPGEKRKFTFNQGTSNHYGRYVKGESLKTDVRSFGYGVEWSSFISSDSVPEIAFDYEVLRRDSIPYGGDGAFDFPFTNTGQMPLIISQVRSSCGCLVPSWDKNPVMPGERGVIKSRYATTRVGPINKSLTVVSNASESTKILRLKGSVIRGD